MINYVPFPRRKRTIKSKYRGIVHSLKRILFWRKEITFSPANIPLTYKVLANTLFSKHLLKWGAYEVENSNWVLKNFSGSKGGFFVDVGANFGWYSLIFSICADSTGHVVAVEPEPGNLRMLQKNISINNAENISVISTGVGACDGFAELSLNTRWNPGMHSLRQIINSTEKIRIQIRTLDSILSNFPGEIDLLKIDIEGFEVDALMGASETLARTKHVLIEYSPKYIQACGRDPMELLVIFERYNFSRYVIKNEKMELCDIDYLIKLENKIISKQTPQVDLFFIKNN